MYDIDVIAKAVRIAYLEHSGMPRPTWEELPENRKVKWRKMAQAAIDTYIEEMP
jgi:hypothetical protein